jgi:NhaP-type Na+/H+ or K+/H+ antiporter
MKLNIPAFTLAFGILWGCAVFFLTWWLIALDADPGTLALLQTAYLGYAISPLGSVVGLAWGFIDGAIGGAVLAWLYNLFVDRFAPAAS